MGAPKFIDIPAAWYGDEMMVNKDLWIYNLTETDIAEWEHAADSYNNLSLPLGKISKENFPLPKFADFLQKTQNELRKGIGFKLIRGLPVSRYEPKTYSTIFGENLILLISFFVFTIGIILFLSFLEKSIIDS